VNVLPVIEWLIMKFFENRELTAKQLRLFSHLQFSKANLALPHEDRDPRVDSGLTDVMTRYKAMRRFKLADGTTRKNTEESRVHSALLEYGETLKSRYGLAGGGGDDDASKSGASGDVSSVITFAGSASGDEKNMSAFERKLAVAAKKAAAAEAELAKEVAAEEDSLLSGMQSLDAFGGAASSKRVGSIVGMGTGEIAAAAAKYNESVEETRRRIEGMGEGGVMGGMASYKRQKGVLEKRKEALQPDLEALEAERRVHEAAMEAKANALREQQAKLAQAQAMVAELEEKEVASGMKDELARLKSLVMMNEQLKGQEMAFKANVKRQLAKLQADIADLDAKGDGAGEDESSRLTEIEAMHVKVMTKYDRLRSFLAERNLDISTNSRLIDDIPTRSELIQ